MEQNDTSAKPKKNARTRLVKQAKRFPEKLSLKLATHLAVAAIVGLCITGYGWATADSNANLFNFGLRVLVDSETGCEYLAANGGLTPRLWANGKQICRNTTEK